MLSPTRVLLFVLPLGLLPACGPQSSTAKLKEAWDPINNPVLIGFEKLKQEYQYTNVLAELPLQAEVTARPWSSDYWPNAHGGAAYRWQAAQTALNELHAIFPDLIGEMDQKVIQPFYAYPLGEPALVPLEQLSPTEKYDRLRSDPSFELTTSERTRTGIMKTVAGQSRFDDGFNIPSWFGLCHSWAAASYLFEPVADIVAENAEGTLIPFAAGDIHALLSIFLDRYNAPDDTQLLGSRCDVSFDQTYKKFIAGEISQQEFDAAFMNSPCSDINAGSFHIVLANQIGRLNEVFLADITRDAEVWNQPVVAFESRIIAQLPPNERAAPGTASMQEVKTAMTYAITTTASVTGEPLYAYDVGAYHYLLELDANGAIIGGQWLDPEQGGLTEPQILEQTKSRPDFMWKRKAPEFLPPFTELGVMYQGARDAFRERNYAIPDPVADMPLELRFKISNFWAQDAINP